MSRKSSSRGLASVDEFMRESGLDETRSPSETARWVYNELKTSLDGGKGELSVYRTLHSAVRPASDGETALVVHVGRDSVHAVRAEVREGRWRMKDIGRWDNLKPLCDAKTPEEYFDCIAKCLKPYLVRSFRMGLCLPFALEAHQDTTIIRPSPVSTLFKTLNGVDAAKEMLAALDRAETGPRGTVRAVAPAVAVLIASSALPRSTPDNSAALVVDSCDQLAFFESGPTRGSYTAVTVPTDRMDPFSIKAREAQAESAASGLSLGPIVHEHVLRACSYGCFSPAAARSLRALKNLPTNALCTWLNAPHPDPSMDAKAFYAIADRILHTMGQYLAACVAGVMRRVGRHIDPDASTFLVVYSDIISASRLLRDNLFEELSAIDPRYRTRVCRLAQLNNSVLIGTACAALEKTPATAPGKARRKAV